jgi:acetylornithine/succinyldiaminopimelate/putrescine aminotransferase
MLSGQVMGRDPVPSSSLVGTSALMPVYAQLPVRPVSGRGSWIIDEDGARWLDAYGGHAVASTGHCHPDVVAAISKQAGELLFYSTALPHPCGSSWRRRWWLCVRSRCRRCSFVTLAPRPMRTRCT